MGFNTLNISDEGGSTTGSGDFGVHFWDGNLDIADGSTISGDFNVTLGTSTSGEATDGYEFIAPSTTFGTLEYDEVDGTWTFTSNGTASFGDTYVFEVIGTSGSDEDNDFVTITFTCFVEGARIATPQGPRAVQDLAPGDMVNTRDSGAMAVRWVGSRTLPARDHMAPIVFAPGAFGNTSELRVSPHHRMLVAGWRAEALFGEKEVLATARDLVNGDTIYRAEGGMVTYWHFMFDSHQIVTAEGIPSESFHPASAGLGALEQSVRDEVLALFPELRDDPACYGPPARKPLSVTEASLLAC